MESPSLLRLGPRSGLASCRTGPDLCSTRQSSVTESCQSFSSCGARSSEGAHESVVGVEPAMIRMSTLRRAVGSDLGLHKLAHGSLGAHKLGSPIEVILQPRGLQSLQDGDIVVESKEAGDVPSRDQYGCQQDHNADG